LRNFIILLDKIHSARFAFAGRTLKWLNSSSDIGYDGSDILSQQLIKASTSHGWDHSYAQ